MIPKHVEFFNTVMSSRRSISSRESPEPQDDTKHLCHPRIHLSSHANIHPQQPAHKQDDTKHLCHPRIHLSSHANIHPQQPAHKRIKFDILDSTSSSIYQPSMSVFNFAEMLEAQDDSIHVKSSQTSLKFVSDTSVVIGDDNDPTVPQ